MSEDLKKALAAIGLATFGLLYGTYSCSTYRSERQAKAEAEAATFQALTPEEKTLARIDGLTEYIAGETIEGRAALQITTRHDLVGISSAKKELLHQAARDIKTAYQLHPDIETLDIEYQVKMVNSYGEISYSPALYIEIDRSTYTRIQWQNFRPENLEQIATVRPLRNL